MDATDMNTVRRIPLFLGAAAGASLVILNVVTATFYLLWMGADQWLVNRSESGGGFDPSQLPPYTHATWFAAHATMLSLVVLDVIAVAAVVLLIRGNRSQADAPAAVNLPHPSVHQA